MSSYRISDAPPQGVRHADDNPTDDIMVIARFPDLDKHCTRNNVIQSFFEATDKSRFPSWILPKKVVWLIAAVLFLAVGWLIFYGSDPEPANTGSWQPDPPAAAAPEAPRWNGGIDRKITSTVIQETPRRPENETKVAANELDETTPRHEQEIADTTIRKVDEKVAPADMQAQTPLVIGTPIPRANLGENENRNVDWTSLSNSEYYWAVRSRSGDASCRTAARPDIDLSSAPRQSAEPQPSGETAAPGRNGTVRLNGVIETPTVRVY